MANSWNYPLNDASRMNSKRNQYVSAMCRVTGDDDPTRAIAKYVDRYRKHGMSLENLATALGVTAITKERLPFAGGVFRQGTKLTIKINSNDIPTRRRFTLAHELAHLIISSGKARALRHRLNSNPLERACDFIAAELLMPMDEALESIERPPSLGSLLSFASRFNVSLQAAAVRIKQLNAWRESIVLWKWEGRPRRLWCVGDGFSDDDQLPVELFSKAMKHSSTVQTSALYRDYRGTRDVSLKVQRLGRNHILGLMRG